MTSPARAGRLGSPSGDSEVSATSLQVSMLQLCAPVGHHLACPWQPSSQNLSTTSDCRSAALCMLALQRRTLPPSCLQQRPHDPLQVCLQARSPFSGLPCLHSHRADLSAVCCAGQRAAEQGRRAGGHSSGSSELRMLWSSCERAAAAWQMRSTAQRAQPAAALGQLGQPCELAVCNWLCQLKLAALHCTARRALLS